MESRKKRAKGRALNRAGAGAAGAVERQAAGILDDPAERERAVERETAALGAAIGDSISNATEASKMAIVDSFLLVHYLGKHSVHPSAKAAEGISGHIVADFYNTIGRVADAGERCFPMGGYFNTFKESGVSAALVRGVREIMRTQYGGGRRSGGGESDMLLKSCASAKAWYRMRAWMGRRLIATLSYERQWWEHCSGSAESSTSQVGACITQLRGVGLSCRAQATSR